MSRLRNLIVMALPLLLILFPHSRSNAQEAIDEAVINQELDSMAEQYNEAYNRHDAHAVALTYAEDCDVEHDFKKFLSRAAIEEATAEYFRDNPQAKTDFADVKRKMLSATVVVESGTWRASNQTQSGLATQGGYVSTLVKTNGRWLVVHERAFSKPLPFPEFFVNLVGGTWREQSTEAEDSYQWILGKRFIQFTSQLGDAKSFGIMGTDPRSGNLTWWIFRNDGQLDVVRTSADSPRTGEHLAQLTSTSTSGKTSAQLKIMLDGQDEARIESAGVINGKALPFTHWMRDKQLADQSWLYAEPPAEIPSSMSCLQALRGPKWISSESDGVPGVGGSYASWILDGKFFLGSASFQGQDNSSWSHLIVIGADPKTGLMTAGWEFASDGAVSEMQIAPDGKSLTGKSVGGSLGMFEFSGKFSLSHGVLDYDARLRQSGQSTDVPYRWVYRDAQEISQ